MNDYDKAGRYLVKREPTAFFRWLLGQADLVVRAWIDARRVALPKQHDLTNDLVAVVAKDDVQEAICLELEAEARADALTKVLGYLLRIWTEPASEGSLPVSCVSAVILDLTGRSPSSELSLRSVLVPNCRLVFTALRRSLAEEEPAALVAGVAAEQLSPWLLGWVPLIQGGNESAIIAAWREAAERRLRGTRDRADLGSLALVIANLANGRAAWERGLKGWNMKTSPFLDEIRAEGRQEGLEQGLERGRIEGARAVLLQMGEQRFGGAPTKRQRQALSGIADLDRLEALAKRLQEAASWAELLANGKVRGRS